MEDLNKITSDITVLKKKILKDLDTFITLYTKLGSDVDSRFKDEYRNNRGLLDGLEDFHLLNYLCKKNLSAAKSAHSVIARIKDISGFDIKEEEIDKELEKLLGE